MLSYTEGAVAKGKLQVGDWLGGDDRDQAISMRHAHSYLDKVRVNIVLGT